MPILPTPGWPTLANSARVGPLCSVSLSDAGSATSACPERIQRRVLSACPECRKRGVSSVVKSDSISLFFVFGCRLLTVACWPSPNPNHSRTYETPGVGSPAARCFFASSVRLFLHSSSFTAHSQSCYRPFTHPSPSLVTMIPSQGSNSHTMPTVNSRPTVHFYRCDPPGEIRS